MGNQLTPSVNDRDHTQGNINAKLVLVEYGDYQCDSCGQAYPILKSIQQTFGDRLKFVFRNFPLSEAHPDAYKAAIAAEAAALQNKFWEMHDIIYEHQNQLDWDHLLSYAKMIGLDLNRFKKDIEIDSITAKIDNDFESGVRSGVNGTPSFFINGMKYNGSWEEDTFIEYLNDHL